MEYGQFPPATMTPSDSDRHRKNLLSPPDAAESCSGRAVRALPRPIIPCAPLAKPLSRDAGATARRRCWTAGVEAAYGESAAKATSESSDAAASPVKLFLEMTSHVLPPRVLLGPTFAVERH